MKFVLISLLFLIGCTDHRAIKLISILKIVSHNCSPPTSGILFSEGGSCRFITTTGKKCTTSELVIDNEQLRICLVTSSAGLEFIRDCETNVDIICQ